MTRSTTSGILQVSGRGRLVSPISIFLLAIGLTFASSLWANPLKDLRRVIDGQPVDLGTLFHWWTNHQGDRPLASWVHVTGSVVGTNAWGWTLEAQTAPSARSAEKPTGHAAPGAGTRIILKHPPRQEQADFENLIEQLKELDGQRHQLSAEVTNANQQSREIASEQKVRYQSRARSRFLSQQAQEVKQAVSRDQDELKTLDKQIQQVRTRLAAYPNTRTYMVDCFALDTGQEFSGVAVYDHGAVVK